MIRRGLIPLIALLFFLPEPVMAENSFIDAVDSANPDHRSVTDDRVRSLLGDFKPEVYVDPTSYRPMSFYGDYLPKTSLRHTSRGTIKQSPARELLKRVAEKSNFYLDYRVPINRVRGTKRSDHSPTYYGRAYVDTVTVNSEPRRLLFLKYSTVFPYSGLPWEINALKWVGSELVGEPRAWHELDIHGSVTVIVDPDRCTPLGVSLAQHNYHRILWRKIDFTWPETNHVKIAYATNSNEPYLLSPERRTRTVRTVGNPKNLAWLYDRQERPLLDAGYDRILAPEDGAVSVPMGLKILPEDDPLYTARMALGDRLKLFYFWSHWTREGPPGINYYAPPRLVDVSNLTAFYDIDRSDTVFWKQFRKREKTLLEFPGDPLLNHQHDNLSQTLEKLTGLRSPSGSHCALPEKLRDE